MQMDTIRLLALRAFANGKPWTIDADGTLRIDDVIVEESAWQPTFLKLYAANARKKLADGGTAVTVGGASIPVWTDTDSRSNMIGAAVGSQMNPAFATGWKGSDGLFYPLSAEGVQSLAQAVLVFVNDAFGREASALAQIDSGAITTTAQIDAIMSAP